MLQGAFQVISPQRDHHSQAALRIQNSVHQVLQEKLAFSLILNLGEQLFKLVDDQHQFDGFVCRQDLLQGLLQAASIFSRACKRAERHLHQGGLQLPQGMGSRRKFDDEPVLRAGQTTAAQGRDQPGFNQ